MRGGPEKWKPIERAGPMEPLEGLYVQRAGLNSLQARTLLRMTRLNSVLPEPLRIAHLVAAGVTVGESRARP